MFVYELSGCGFESRSCQVSFSSLTTRNDQYREKALEVNQHLKVLSRKNINIIDHENIITVRHLNGSKLHLNLKGNKVLTEKFAEAGSNILHLQCLKNLGEIVISYLNINSIRQKYDSLVKITTGYIVILMILETKFDESFPKGQFLLKGFSEHIGWIVILKEVE